MAQEKVFQGYDANGKEVWGDEPSQSAASGAFAGYDAQGKEIFKAPDETKKPEGHGVASGVADFLSGLWEKQPIHPSAIVQGVDQAFYHPIDTVQKMLQAQGAPFANAEQAFKKGDYAQGVTSLLNWLIPSLGPQNEENQQRAISGQDSPAKFVGKTLGLGAQAASMAPGTVADAVGSLRVPAIARNPNPVSAQAVEFGQSRGIPVDAATATGNRAVAAVQNVADRSLGGWLGGSGQAQQAQAAGLGRVGEELAAQAHPTPVTPLQAGKAVTDTIEGTIRGLHDVANASYDELRRIEQLPANVKTVKAAIRDSQGNEVPGTKPMAQDIGLPVDVLSAKRALRPVYDSLMRQLPLTQRQASPGLQALGNILSGPDVAALSQVETDLGAIKAMTRGAEMPELRGVGQGVAAKAVSELDRAVVKAASADPDALAALQVGRAATAKKYQVAEVLSQLQDEPVRVFNQATYANDAGVEQLKQIAKIAPKDLPKIGRAYLDDLMGQATAEGGFDKARTLATKWSKLGDQTKQMLFKDPDYIKDLDKFFMLAKKIGESPNPSGTAHTVLVAGQTGLLVTNPLTGSASVIGTAALSKLLHSPAGVRLLTKGFQVPVGNPAAATAIFGDLSQALDLPMTGLAPMVPVPAHAQRQGGGQ